MRASGRWWWTRTSTPATSTRCCGRCARGSIRSTDIDLIQKAWASKRDPLFLPGNFNNRILIDACIPYDMKLKGTFPIVVDVSADLRREVAGEVPAILSEVVGCVREAKPDRAVQFRKRCVSLRSTVVQGSRCP